MRVDEIMSKPVVTVPAEMSIKQAARLLVDRDISAAPVLEDDELVGIVAEADVMQVELHEDPRRHVRPDVTPVGTAPATVADVMTRDVLAVPPDADVADVARRMLERRLRTVPIVDGGSLVGIVSRRDVLTVLLRTDEDIARDLRELVMELPSSLGVWSCSVREGVVCWRGSGPEEMPAFLSKVAFTVPGVVDVRVEEG